MVKVRRLGVGWIALGPDGLLRAYLNGWFSGQSFTHSNQELAQSQGHSVTAGWLPYQVAMVLGVTFLINGAGVFFPFPLGIKNKRV
jgi:hypothetical protein